MEKQTQHEKIIDFCRDGEWHCQRQFWSNFIMSPHKRRKEIEKEGKYFFDERPCEHGTKASKDFRLRLNTAKYREVTYTVPAIGKVIKRIERIPDAL